MNRKVRIVVRSATSEFIIIKMEDRAMHMVCS